MPSYKDEATGKWYCSFYYTDLRGKRVRKLKRGFALKREADKWEREFLSTEHADEITIGKLIEEFERELDNEYAKGNLKRSSVYDYKRTIRYYITDYFKDTIASMVQPKHINDWLADITKIKPKPLKKNSRYYIDHPDKVRKTRRSSNTVNSARSMLSRIYEFGIANYGLKDNPVEQTKCLKKYSNDKRAKLWTIDQYKLFRESLERRDMVVLFDTIYFAGLRLGEILALTPADIYPTYIDISKGLVQLEYNNQYIDTPKTDTSKALQPIPSFIYEELTSFINSEYGIKDNDIIFDIKEQTIRTHLNAQARKCGLPLISPHILRHSYVSNVMDATKNIAVASQLARHANPGVTMRIYAHMIPGAEQEAFNALEDMNPNKK